jgi:hypothetical protein
LDEFLYHRIIFIFCYFDPPPETTRNEFLIYSSLKTNTDHFGRFRNQLLKDPLCPMSSTMKVSDPIRFSGHRIHGKYYPSSGKKYYLMSPPYFILILHLLLSQFNPESSIERLTLSQWVDSGQCFTDG